MNFESKAFAECAGLVNKTTHVALQTLPFDLQSPLLIGILISQGIEKDCVTQAYNELSPGHQAILKSSKSVWKSLLQLTNQSFEPPVFKYLDESTSQNDLSDFFKFLTQLHPSFYQFATLLYLSSETVSHLDIYDTQSLHGAHKAVARHLSTYPNKQNHQQYTIANTPKKTAVEDKSFEELVTYSRDRMVTVLIWAVVSALVCGIAVGAAYVKGVNVLDITLMDIIEWYLGRDDPLKSQDTKMD